MSAQISLSKGDAERTLSRRSLLVACQLAVNLILPASRLEAKLLIRDTPSVSLKLVIWFHCCRVLQLIQLDHGCSLALISHGHALKTQRPWPLHSSSCLGLGGASFCPSNLANVRSLSGIRQKWWEDSEATNCQGGGSNDSYSPASKRGWEDPCSCAN